MEPRAGVVATCALLLCCTLANQADAQKTLKNPNATATATTTTTTAATTSGVTVAAKGSDSPRPTYFIAADKVAWNYAPSGANKCYAPSVVDALATKGGYSNPGGTYWKALYIAYSDNSFATPAQVDPEWAHLGSLGPTIYAVVGSTVRLVFKNNLDFPVNVAPGGLVAAAGSAEPGPVPPGATVTYIWTVPAEAGPAAGSTLSSRLWLYRSDVDVLGHDSAGLVGGVVVVGAGQAKANGRPKDVDREIITLFQVVKEDNSPYAAVQDPDLIAGASPIKMTINGYVWCNMDPAAISLATGSRVRWHVASVGTEDGLHNWHWHGFVVELNGHYTDQFTGLPVNTYSVNVQPDEPGIFMMHCHVNDHLDGGMVTTYTVTGAPAPFVMTGVERTFYVAAEEAPWDYLAGTGKQSCMSPAAPFGPGVDGNQFVEGPSASPIRLGPSLLKARYVEYTDATFQKPKARSANDAYLGVVGPLLRANVGDRIKVVFLNRGSFPYTMHPHGVRYSKANEGAPYTDGTAAGQKLDDGVPPGGTYTYTWLVRDRAGPGPNDPSSMLWMYHSHSDETADTNTGLVGGILITRPGMARSWVDLTPSDVDREVVLFFSIFNEINSLLLQQNVARVAADTAADPSALAALAADPDFQEHMLKHSINGHLFCNMPPLRFTAGDRVRVHIMTLGTIVDMHTPTFLSARYNYDYHSSQSVQMSPGGMVSTDVLMAQPGNFELQCRVGDHIAAGMRALYAVLPAPSLGGLLGGIASKLFGATRTYYVQAEPLDWDYAPSGYQMCTNTDLAQASQVFLQMTTGTIGSKYRKAVYREYTDASFTRPKAAQYGTLGPMLVAETGDRIVVVFRNALTDLPDYPVNMAPGGGILDDGSDAACASVAAGATCTYRWLVPYTSGPMRDDFNSVAYTYLSTVDPITSPNAGLVGPLVVVTKGQMQAKQLLPLGVDAMVPLYWHAVDENVNPYLAQNALAAGVDLAAVQADPDLSAQFEEGNRMHSINGYSYCNMPRPQLRSGQRVRWVLMSHGTEVDVHSPTFANHAVQVDKTGYSTVATLMPGVARCADMVAGAPGVYDMSCQVHDHYSAGMIAEFQVNDVAKWK